MLWHRQEKETTKTRKVIPTILRYKEYSLRRWSGWWWWWWGYSQDGFAYSPTHLKLSRQQIRKTEKNTCTERKPAVRHVTFDKTLSGD